VGGQRRDPIELGARALRHRDRSRRQIDERLARAGMDDEERADALDRLERVGYLDDTRFAAGRAAALAARGYGDEAIRLDLGRAGVDGDVIAAALGALEEEEARAIEVAERLGRTPRIAARLARHGFTQESVEAALKPGVAETDM
jgi:regulatory protein